MIEGTHLILAWGGMPGGWEWVVILIVALLIFGKRLPEIARSMGKSLSSFKKGLRDAEEAKDEVVKDINEAADKAETPSGKDDTDRSS